MQNIHKYFTFTALLFMLSGCFATKQTEFQIVNDHGQVCSQIIEILELTNVQTDGTLPDIVKKTQENWLRKPGVERWEMEKYITQHDAKLKNLFQTMNMQEETKPTQQHYTHLLILGGLFPRMQLRVAYAAQLFNSGIRCDNIVLLAGQRPSVPKQGENLQAFLDYSKQETLTRIPDNEADMLQFVYDHASLPEQMKQIPVQMISTPMQVTQSGTTVRPSTADTIAQWLATNPTPGNCLAISNQPYVAYQHSVIKTLLPSNFSIETAGPAGTADIAIMLDTLARILYQEQQIFQKKL